MFSFEYIISVLNNVIKRKDDNVKRNALYIPIKCGGPGKLRRVPDFRKCRDVVDLFHIIETQF